jgi:PTS system ascorbate-specific IIA component
MMAGLVLVAHAPVASAMLSCIEHILGKTPERVVAIDILPDADLLKAREKLLRAVESVDAGTGVLLLSDLFGATPCNLAMEVASAYTGSQCALISGLNAPMLLRTLTYRDQTLQSLAEKAVLGGRNGIVSSGTLPQQKQNTNVSDRHGPAGDYHQQ